MSPVVVAEEELIRKIHAPPKLFHSYMRLSKISHRTVGPLRPSRGRLVVDSIDKGDVFPPKRMTLPVRKIVTFFLGMWNS